MDVLIRLPLIIAMVVCPANCLEVPGDRSARQAEPAACTCCCHAEASSQASPSSNLPADPSEDCGCADCLCRGAVVEVARNDLARAEFSFYPIGPFVHPPAVTTGQGPSATSVFFAGRPDEPHGLASRARRLLHQSLLL